MSNKTTYVVAALIAGIVATVLCFALRPALTGGSSGPDEYFQKNFLAGYTVGSSNNTPVNARNCASATWNPVAVGSTTDASIDVAVSGYTIGDQLNASLNTSTQGLAITAMSTSSPNTTATVVLFDPDNSGAAIDIATATVTLCYVH